jgi:hypothetical protein
MMPVGRQAEDGEGKVRPREGSGGEFRECTYEWSFWTNKSPRGKASGERR